MTPDQFEIFLERNEKANAAAIEKYVNGDIRDLRSLVEAHNIKHEADMVEVREHIASTKPVLEAYKGFNTAGNLVKWMAGVGTAVGILWLSFVQIIKGL